MAGNPAGAPPPGYGQNLHHDLLLDLETDQPVYGGGQRSTLTDDDLLEREYARENDPYDGLPPPRQQSYLQEQQPQAPPRPSISYDDFVSGGRGGGGGGGGVRAVGPADPGAGTGIAGRGGTGAGAGVGAGAGAGAGAGGLGLVPGPGAQPDDGSAGSPSPYFDRIGSSHSDLHGYQRYADEVDDDAADSDSYYQNGGRGGAGGQAAGREAAMQRNTVLGLGGGWVGKIKNSLGMGQGYSEMDLPLTEPGRARPGALRQTVSYEPKGQGQGPESGPGPGPGPGQPDSRRHRQAGSGSKFDMGNFRFGFGRGKPDPSTLGPRIIHLNNPPANAVSKYVDNHVSTAKYNVFTFLPKFLSEQFSKFANVFFLFTSLLQQIPNLSPTNQYTTLVPLAIVLIISAAKELVEDMRRKTADRALNESRARVLRGTAFADTKWVNVAVGDIIRVESEEPFPADLVLLASSEPEGLCYIETANLDGETNLKIKQALPETSSMVSTAELSRLGGRIRSEQPNSSLYTYEATVTLHAGGGERELALTPEQLLLRGATLRNTPWVHAVVVFTGHETKLMRNATATPIKRTKVEQKLNWFVLLLVGILLALSIICTVGDLVIRRAYGSGLSYLALAPTGSAADVAANFARDMVTYWILFSSLVPISLFVTVEMVKYCHGLLINDDLDMYYDRTDTPATCRTSSLTEELGMVEYVFSDKTGTLTCNMMEFKQCSIGGVRYGDDVPEDQRAAEQEQADEQFGAGADPGVYGFDRLRERCQDGAKGAAHAAAIDHFCTLLAICHTVIPERDESAAGKIRYQAASPDEGALVAGAAELGYRFVARKPRAVIIEVAGRGQLEYELLAVCEFNSTRKRMSAVYRCPDGKIRCYCKGADTVIMERLVGAGAGLGAGLAPGTAAGGGGPDPAIAEATLHHLEDYAGEGLRTLCLAMREIPRQEFEEWHRIFDAAQTTVGGSRADELDKAAEILEHDFTLLGATAIEDRLQDGVPETIHTLQQAGVKVWVLTGDRQETAINIGMSCRLLSEDMMLLIINEETAEATRDNLQKKTDALRAQMRPPGGGGGDGGGLAAAVESDALALVIDGKSLTFALERDLEKLFLDLAVACKAVICCRVSPLQKALVVKLVKKYRRGSVLLAIGDGANDVSMIQAAHIGVGISGLEGMQAARSADVAVGQFRFLRKLLLVHGAWSYRRVTTVILFSFYKNITLYMTQFWFTFQNVFSGQVIFESWTLSFYNVFYTFLPPLAIGVLDQVISARLLDRYPQLYMSGQRNEFFRRRDFFSWIGNAVYHSILLYLFGELLWYGDLIQSDGKIAGHWVWGTSMYASTLLTVLGKAALVTNNWTKYHVMAIPGSMVVWWALTAAYGIVAPLAGVSREYFGVIPRLYPSPVFWLQTFGIAALCLLRDFVWKYARRMYWPKTYHHIQEIQKYNIQDYRPRMEQFQKAIRKVRQVQRMRKQRGYAFSQADESQTRVLQAYDTTQNRGLYGEMASSRRR